MKVDPDTPIAAIATAPGPAGVCVVRLSGKGVLEMADQLFPKATRRPSRQPPGTFFHAEVIHPRTHEKLDDVLVLIFHAPHSYTGEDVVEIQGHGGTLPSRRLLEAALAAGAQVAGPGEFTKRAFLNGRLDLTQAEALCDFIQAKSERSAHVARAQMEGRLGSRIHALYTQMTHHCAGIEHQLDFDEGELPDHFLHQSAEKIGQTLCAIQQHIHSWTSGGHLLREGACVVISGKPNVGKSSLLNVLLGTERAIVHAVPGTTRDVIEERIVIEGIPLRLIDTAGLRDTEDDVERQGIRRTRHLMGQADLNLYLVEMTDETVRHEVGLPEALSAERTLVVFTKRDQISHLHQPVGGRVPQGFTDVCISSHTGEGLEGLKRQIVRKLGLTQEIQEDAVVTLRQLQELRLAEAAATSALAALRVQPCDLVIAANHLRDAAEALGRIVGRVYSDDLLETLFSRFCVGK